MKIKLQKSFQVLRKLVLIFLFVLTGCDNKFDGLQGGIFTNDEAKLTFDDERAYFNIRTENWMEYELKFLLNEPNPKMINDFTQLFEKYNSIINYSYRLDKNSFTYIDYDKNIEKLLRKSDFGVVVTLLAEGHSTNPIEKEVIIIGDRAIERFKKIIGRDASKLLKEISYDIHNFERITLSKYFYFIYDYNKVSQNQISLTKPIDNSNLYQYQQFTSDVEKLINGYKSAGYRFEDSSVLKILSDVELIESIYDSNYYLNKGEGFYTLQSLNNSFSYSEIR